MDDGNPDYDRPVITSLLGLGDTSQIVGRFSQRRSAGRLFTVHVETVGPISVAIENIGCTFG